VHYCANEKFNHCGGKPQLTLLFTFLAGGILCCPGVQTFKIENLQLEIFFRHPWKRPAKTAPHLRFPLYLRLQKIDL
jgi:hypothetical protein